MKTYPGLKTTAGVEATLEDLHQESRQWLSQLSFWLDEASFFMKVLKNKHLKAISEGKTALYDQVSISIQSYKDKILKNLKNDIEQHENLLAEVLRKKQEEDETYRQKHQDLLRRISRFEEDYQKSKKDIFIIYEDWS